MVVYVFWAVQNIIISTLFSTFIESSLLFDSIGVCIKQQNGDYNVAASYLNFP